MQSSLFLQRAAQIRECVDAALRRYTMFPAGCPGPLAEAIRYALLAPGKRVRPMLVVMAAEACGAGCEAALPPACAVEMIHAYSLVHDDLPAMDDDDLRRGRPTCHKRFGEATAILAGDALLTLAFEVLAKGVRPPQAAAACCAALAEAAGACSLVGGQADDIRQAEEARAAVVPAGAMRVEGNPEGASASSDVGRIGNPSCCRADHRDGLPIRPTGKPTVTPSPSQGDAARPAALEMLESIHARKTGAMILVALRLGGMVAGADGPTLAALEHYGRCLGLAFQITDDLLDIRGEEATVGKRVGKDTAQGKLTFPGLLGLEASISRAEQLVADARAALRPLGDRSGDLDLLARHVLERNR
ncbi:MAG: polyprenyl synthetase family protein [Thermoguttaceae bacterium]